MNNEYLIQKETLTGLADEIRVLSGATAPISTEEMTSSVADANDEVSAQATTIAEISALLEGKSVPDSSEGIVIETCTVTLDTSAAGTTNSGNLAYIAYENGELVLKTLYTIYATMIGMVHPTIECIKNTNIIIGSSVNIPGNTSSFAVSGNIELVSYEPNTLGASFKVTGDGAITWTA